MVSTAIVLRSLVLRRRYRLQLQGQFDDIFRQPGDSPSATRRKNFGEKPKLWDAWTKLDEERDSVNELADIKVCCGSRFSLLMFQPFSLCRPSRSASCTSHKKLISPQTRPPHRQCLSLKGPLPSWLGFSPTHSHFHATLLKVTTLEVTRPTRLQKYPVQFRSRSSSPCPRQPAEQRPHPTPWRKSFPMLRLGSLNFALPMNNILVPTFCIFRPSWLMLTSSHGQSLPSLVVVALGYPVAHVPSLSPLLTRTPFCLSDHSLLSKSSIPPEYLYA